MHRKTIKMVVQNNKTFEEGFNEFLCSCKARNLRQETIRHYTEGYANIITVIHKNLLLSQLDQRTINLYVNHIMNKNISSTTKYININNLKRIVNFFINKEYIKKDIYINSVKLEDHTKETYTDRELNILLKKPKKNCSFVEYRTWVIINVFLATGIRLRSLINIKVKDIDFNSKLLYITYTKNRKLLIIPINDSLIRVLKSWLIYRKYESEEDYLFCNWYGEQLKKITLQASIIRYNKKRGVNSLGIHKFRHTFAKKWILSGGNVVTLSKILGHSSLDVTQKYINLLTTDLTKEVEEIDILREFEHTIKFKKEK